MNRTISVLLLTLCLQCCDPINLTQTQAPTIEFEDQKTSVPADGVSRLLVTMKFQRPLSGEQEVNIGVTNGLLSSFPFSGTTASLEQSLIVNPRSDSFSFLLLASKEPDEEVLLNVTLNGLVATKALSFTKVCPDEILFDLTNNEISISSGNDIAGTVKLFNNTRSVSDGTRIDLLLSNDSLATVPSHFFYTEGMNETIIITSKDKKGELTITARVNEPGCSALEISRDISFID